MLVVWASVLCPAVVEVCMNARGWLDNANLACHCAVMRMVVEFKSSISMYLVSIMLVRLLCYPHQVLGTWQGES
jgi:hypothetical protein